MQKRTTSLFAALALAGGLCALADSARTVEARRLRLPFVKGSYFGRFVSSTGNETSADVNISIQDGRKIAGVLNLGGRAQEVLFTGSISSRRFQINGKSGQGSSLVRIRVDANLQPGGADNLTVVTGTYRMSGAIRERGTVSLTGQSDPLPEPDPAD